MELKELGAPGALVEPVDVLGDEGDRTGTEPPLKGREGCDFSFSGLKTAVRQIVVDAGSLSGTSVPALADERAYPYMAAASWAHISP